MKTVWLEKNFWIRIFVFWLAFVIIPFYDNKLFEQPEKSSEVVVPYLYSFFYSNTHKKYFGMVSKELKNIICPQWLAKIVISRKNGCSFM